MTIRLRLSEVRHGTDHDGTATLLLNYVRGSEEANVRVTITPDESVTAECERLYADSHMDEIVLETHAEGFARDHADAFGVIEE